MAARETPLFDLYKCFEAVSVDHLIGCAFAKHVRQIRIATSFKFSPTRALRDVLCLTAEFFCSK